MTEIKTFVEDDNDVSETSNVVSKTIKLFAIFPTHSGGTDILTQRVGQTFVHHGGENILRKGWNIFVAGGSGDYDIDGRKEEKEHF